LSEVLLGQAYHLRFDPKLWRAMEPYPPLGTLYAAAVLRERGFDVAVHDAMLARDERDWEARLESERPRYAVLFEDSFNYLSKMCLSRMREAGLRMLAAAKRSGAVTAVCGSDASDRPDVYLAGGADYVVVGEGETSLAELLERLRAAPGVPPREIPGLIYRCGDHTVNTPARPPMRDLDALPEPARELIDLEPYRRAWGERGRRFSLNLVSTRGCPFHCNWCAKPIWGQRYAVRSAHAVAREMERLHRELGAGHLWFADDILGLRPGWSAELAGELHERRLRVPFKCLSRADLLLREGEVEALARAGCESVWIGAESGSQKVLDAMEKGIGVGQIREASRRLRAAGIGVGFFLQFGYPGEGMQEIRQTLRLVRECAPDEIGISVSYPLPGTGFHERVARQLGAKRNWVDSEDLDTLYDGPFSTGFYRQLVRLAARDFRFRQALRGAPVRSGAGPRPPLRRAAAAGLHAALLPFEWARLEVERLRPHAGAVALAPGLSREEAATPSAQR
jgi:radical SAM superfamily enzyme YgiQ (UPF0313 family)